MPKRYLIRLRPDRAWRSARLQFAGRTLRDLLLEAIRYGEQPEVRARLTTVRAAARRLQPHYVESFFRAAFARLGGSLRQTTFAAPSTANPTSAPTASTTPSRTLARAEPPC